MEKFRTANIDLSFDEFFQTGRDHVGYVLDRLGRDFGFVVLNDTAKAIDFGCGVGRCTAALMPYFSHVTGYDVSDGMIKLARSNIMMDQGSRASRWSLTSDPSYLDVVGRSVNLIHSVLVFQHIPPAEGYPEIGRLLQCLADGGCGMLHISVARHTADIDQCVNSYSGPELQIKMFAYSIDRVVEVLSANQISKVTIDLRDMGDRLLSANFFFCRDK